MIALVATLLVAIYILGPDLLARWVLGFVVPRKTLALTKSEEITRGFMWAIVPLLMAWWLRHLGWYSFPHNAKIDLQVFFSGLYSETYFNSHQAQFFAASTSFLELNRCLLLRLYVIVLLGSLLSNFIIQRYGLFREWLRDRKGAWPLCRSALSTFVLPRISEWHLVLSSVLLPSQTMSIEVDVLTKGGVVYSGRLSDKALSPTGELESLTLDGPRRFRREQYLQSLRNNQSPNPDDFWRGIPGNMFVIPASEISTLNIRHIPAVTKFGQQFSDIADALKVLEKKLKDLEKS
ncbi:MAG: hypothetical protein ACLGP3_06225, partial [Acidobacteriota bacterium]